MEGGPSYSLIYMLHALGHHSSTSLQCQYHVLQPSFYVCPLNDLQKTLYTNIYNTNYLYMFYGPLHCRRASMLDMIGSPHWYMLPCLLYNQLRQSQHCPPFLHLSPTLPILIEPACCAPQHHCNTTLKDTMWWYMSPIHNAKNGNFVTHDIMYKRSCKKVLSLSLSLDGS